MASALTTELTSDPLGRGYAQMSDADAADSLNAADTPVIGTIDAVLLRQRLVLMACETDPAYALALTYWRHIASEAADPQDAAAYGRWKIANTLVATYDAHVSINLGIPDIALIAEQAVQLGLLSVDQLALLNSDATRMISRAEVIGLGPVSHEMIAEARNG